MSRIYLPEEDLRRFGVAPEDLRQGRLTPSLQQLLEFEAERAWSYYSEGARLLHLIEEDSRPALWALARIYSGILEKIQERHYDVFSAGEVRLSSLQKIAIMLRAQLGIWTLENGFGKRHRDRRRAGGAGLSRRPG
jgi:phytoene synthase